MKLLKLFTRLFLLLFGSLSIFMTLSVIFDWFHIRDLEGQYVLFVVYANLLCGVIYLVSAGILSRHPKWSGLLLALSSLVLTLTFLFLWRHINNGGAYEPKTIKAMTFRTLITILLSIFCFYFLRFKKERA